MRFTIIALSLALAFATAPASAAGAYLNDLLKEPAYLASWNALFAGSAAPDWVADFAATSNGVVMPSEDVEIGGKTYVYASLCKPHDCAGNMLGVVFTSDGSQAWGLLVAGGTTQTFGNPGGAIEAALKAKVE